MAEPRTIAELRLRLKGFVEPDTASQYEGWLDPGRYIVLEHRPNHPTPDTDYTRLLAPGLGASDTWVCSRWKDQVYASISEQAPPVVAPVDFAGDPMAVEEAALIAHLAEFREFHYDFDEACYPAELPGVRVPLAPPATNNCCTFAEALLVAAWADSVAGFEWGARRHRQMMIMSADDYFSPVTAVIEAGMARTVPDPDSPPAPWTLIQGWRRQWQGGHTFIVVDYHEDSGRVLTLESNSGYGLDGCGYRGIGNLRDAGLNPPANWWALDRVPDWDRICATYRYRQQADLKVTGLGWSRPD